MQQLISNTLNYIVNQYMNKVVAKSLPKLTEYELKRCEIVSGTAMILLSK